MSMEKKNAECRCPDTNEMKRNGVPGRGKNEIKGIIMHGGEKSQMIILRKDIGSNATGSKILPVGINSKDKRMSWQILTSNETEKNPTNEIKNFIEKRRF